MATKRPDEEENSIDKEKQKKEKESSASLLQKGIAERVTAFLSTKEGKESLAGGKELFIEKFLQSRESSDETMLLAYKALLGKKADDELTLSDLADIRVDYDTTVDSYVDAAESRYVAELQEQAIAQAFLQNMTKEIEGKHFSTEHRNAWKQYVSSHQSSIVDKGDLDRLMKKFFAQMGTLITDEQKARLKKVSIDFRDVGSFIAKQPGVEKELADKFNKKEIIAGNTEMESSVKQFLRTYVQTELEPAYRAHQEKTKELHSIYKVPGFQKVLQSYDLSAQTLMAQDKAFQKVYTDPTISEADKLLAQQKATSALIAKKDPELARLVDALFQHNYNLARLDKKDQQLYVDRFHGAWNESAEMQSLDRLLGQFETTSDQRKEITKQIFDLSKTELRIRDASGTEHVIPFEKKIIDREWSAESVSEGLAHEMPLVFLMKANDQIEDAYLQKVAKVEKKSFVLKDADGKEQTIFPGNLVEVTTADGQTHQGYIYQDPQGNVLLSEQPGSNKKITLSADQMASSHAKVVEPTYALQTEDIPVLLTEFALLNAVANRSDEKNKEGVDQRNADIAQESVAQNFVPEKKTIPTDEEIEKTDRTSTEEVNQYDDATKEQIIAYTDDRINSNNKRIDALDNKITDKNKQIDELDHQLTAKQSLKNPDQEEVRRLQNELHAARNKRDDMIDERARLINQNNTFQSANSALRNVRSNKPVDSTKLGIEEKEEKEFLEAWHELMGDKTIEEPVPGKTCIMALLPDSSSSLSGGGGAWVRGDIVGYDKNTHTFQIKRHGIEGKLEGASGNNLEGTISTVQGTSGLSQLKRMVSKLYKFKNYPTVSQWGLDLKGGVTASDDSSAPDSRFHFDKKYEGWRKHLKDDINFSSMKSQRTGKDIQYFGKKVGDERAWYEVEVGGNSVTVKEIKLAELKDKKGDVVGREKQYTYERKMSPNDFMMFAMEKDLRGYTQEDVDKANGADEDKSKVGRDYIDDMVEAHSQPAARFGRGAFGLKRGSIAGIISSWDLVTKGVKNFFDEKTKKEKAKVESAMLNSSWFKGLEKLPVLGGAFEDIRGGIESKEDNEKKKKINEYKDEVGTKKDSSSNGASDFIKNVLTDKEAHKDPLKAAGYYLAALDQGNPYFRTLNGMEKGRWIKQILGPGYQKEYVAYINTVEQDLKNNPSSKELQNDLSMAELGFMQKVFNGGRDNGVQDELKDMLGNRFFAGGLGQAQYGSWYNDGKIDEVVKGEGSKPFHQLFTDLWAGHYEKFRINDVLGLLKLLSDKVGSNEDYYYKWAGSMLMPLMNGQYRTDMSASYKSIYQTLARKNAFPFAAYVTEGNAPEKIEQLIDIFSDGSLGKAMEGKSSPADRTKAFKEWRENPNGQGRRVLDKLQNPKELFAMKNKLQTQVGDQEKLNQFNTLSDYINNKYNDDDRSGITDQVDGESIIYQKNILSAPTGFVKEQMLNFSNGQFKGRSEKNGPELRSALKAKLNDINSIPEDQMTPEFFSFILKRYFAMFGQKYNGTAKRSFIGSLKFPDLMPEIFQLQVRGVFDKKFSGTDLPSEVEDSLVIFEQIFKKFSGLVKQNPEMLDDVFDDARMVDYFRTMKTEDMVKAAETTKKLQNMLKQRAELGEDEFSSSYDYQP